MCSTKVVKFDMEPGVIVDKQVATTHLFKCLESIPNCPYRLSRYSLSTEHVWERNWADVIREVRVTLQQVTIELRGQNKKMKKT